MVPLLKRRPFRFLAGWIEHLDFGNFVKEKRGFTGDMMATFGDFSRDFKEWNKSVNGHITSRKRLLTKKLAKIQRIIDFTGSNRLAQVEMRIQKELENVLYHEELLWKQKARCNWLNLGDQNTKFFHIRTLR